ncbi:cupin domain-containing protein [Bacillus piscicola]|uniref:cupin domain-containing protein n=1 Tax=Bacillus piscicola TaxID=1632684 RepID=UPI001F09A823|nr:cupin domain-containing protein [Bacillus piscicola]
MKNEEVTPMTFKDDGEIPNNEELPVLLYSGVFADNPEECRQTFSDHNWKNSWVGSVYDYDHYHSNTHEVLGIINGTARIRIGGKDGTMFDLREGDVLVLPAGTGHKKMSASFDFRLVGAYPNGMDYNVKTGKAEERPDVLEDIHQVPLPNQDPIFGEEGPLIKIWVNKEY